MDVSLSSFTQEFLTSIIFVGIIIGLRTLLVRMVRRNQEILSKEQRRWINRIKNAAIIVLFICLALIWAPQLQTFALSLTAFAVALVVATKEMILCITGSLFRVSTRPYKVGDWISIDGLTGEVMEINAFSTRLEEIDVSSKSYEFTGKSVIVPNSKLFTATVENQNFNKVFVFQDVTAVVQCSDVDPKAAAEIFKNVTEASIQPFKDDAIKFARRVSRKAGIDLPDPLPSYGFRTTELGHFVFTGRIFIPTKESSDTVSSIIQEFSWRMHQVKSMKDQARQQGPIEIA